MTNEKDKSSEKKIRRFLMEKNPHDLIGDIGLDKSKEQCWFKKNFRFVDPFILGAARSVFYELPRKEINKKQAEQVMEIDILRDSDELLFILKVMGYFDRIYHGKTPEEKEKSHEILFDSNECLKIAEEYFKAGWVEVNKKQSLKYLLEQYDFPDSEIIKDFDDIYND